MVLGLWLSQWLQRLTKSLALLLVVAGLLVPEKAAVGRHVRAVAASGLCVCVWWTWCGADAFKGFAEMRATAAAGRPLVNSCRSLPCVPFSRGVVWSPCHPAHGSAGSAAKAPHKLHATPLLQLAITP